MDDPDRLVGCTARGSVLCQCCGPMVCSRTGGCSIWYLLGARSLSSHVWHCRRARKRCQQLGMCRVYIQGRFAVSVWDPGGIVASFLSLSFCATRFDCTWSIPTRFSTLAFAFPPAGVGHFGRGASAPTFSSFPCTLSKGPRLCK